MSILFKDMRFKGNSSPDVYCLPTVTSTHNSHNFRSLSVVSHSWAHCFSLVKLETPLLCCNSLLAAQRMQLQLAVRTN